MIVEPDIVNFEYPPGVLAQFETMSVLPTFGLNGCSTELFPLYNDEIGLITSLVLECFLGLLLRNCQDSNSILLCFDVVTSSILGSIRLECFLGLLRNIGDLVSSLILFFFGGVRTSFKVEYLLTLFIFSGHSSTFFEVTTSSDFNLFR